MFIMALFGVRWNVSELLPKIGPKIDQIEKIVFEKSLRMCGYKSMWICNGLDNSVCIFFAQSQNEKPQSFGIVSP